MLHDETGAYKISEEAVAAAVREWATTHGLRVDTSTSTLPEIYADTDGRVVDQKRRRVQSHALLHDGVNHFADGVFFGKFLDNFDEGSYAPVLGVMYHLNDGARRAGTRASLSLRNEASEPPTHLPPDGSLGPEKQLLRRPIRDDEPPSCGGFNDRNHVVLAKGKAATAAREAAKLAKAKMEAASAEASDDDAVDHGEMTTDDDDTESEFPHPEEPEADTDEAAAPEAPAVPAEPADNDDDDDENDEDDNSAAETVSTLPGVVTPTRMHTDVVDDDGSGGGGDDDDDTSDSEAARDEDKEDEEVSLNVRAVWERRNPRWLRLYETTAAFTRLDGKEKGCILARESAKITAMSRISPEYAPLEELNSFIQELNAPEPMNVMLIGAGCGAPLEALDALGANWGKAVVLEINEDCVAVLKKNWCVIFCRRTPRVPHTSPARSRTGARKFRSSRTRSTARTSGGLARRSTLCGARLLIFRSMGTCTLQARRT